MSKIEIQVIAGAAECKREQVFWKRSIIPKQISPVLDSLEQANGFYLRLSNFGKPNFQHESQVVLDVTPTIRKGPISVSIPRWKASTICPAVLNGANYNFLDGNQQEIFCIQERSTTSSPRSFGRFEEESSRLVHVCTANKADPVGWIKSTSGNDMKEGLIIMEYGSDVIYILDFFYLDDVKAMKISKLDGTTVATMQPKKGRRDRETKVIRWTDWKMHFTQSFLKNVTIPIKVITLSAFLLAIKIS